MANYSDILITTNYERTITAPDATIPKQNLEAIRHFIENGGAFTVNTGRTVPSAANLNERINKSLSDESQTFKRE